jgi:HEAT repeat protein
MSKLEEIENLANGSIKNINRLLVLSRDSDEEVRYRALEAFEYFQPTDSIRDRVQEGLGDEDELVRSTCAELLGDWKDRTSTEALYLALSDESEIVRSAAITSLGKISRKDTSWILKDRFPNMSGVERASAAMALYSLGETDYLDELLSLFDDEDYRTRCAAANLISGFIADKDKPRATARMKQALLKEETNAASSSLKEAIEALESY